MLPNIVLLSYSWCSQDQPIPRPQETTLTLSKFQICAHLGFIEVIFPCTDPPTEFLFQMKQSFFLKNILRNTLFVLIKVIVSAYVSTQAGFLVDTARFKLGKHSS